MGTTANYSLPYPEGTDPVVVHTDVKKLADMTDEKLKTTNDRVDGTDSNLVALEGRTSNTETKNTEQDIRLDTNDAETSRIGDLLEPVAKGDPAQFRVLDRSGRVAVKVGATGNVEIADTTYRASDAVHRVMDQDGRIAYEVDAQGRTHIYDLVASGAGMGLITVLHVFVCGGQSNMSGRGRVLIAPLSPRILQFGANRKIIEPAPVILDMVDEASGTSPALFFAHNYLATQPANVGVLLIPAAKGGTTFTGSPEAPADTWTWVKGAAIDPEHALYDRSVQQTLDAITAAKSAGYETVLKGVLWHQGEGNGGTAPEVYAGWLDDLITNYRADLDHANLPVVIGRMCPEGIVSSGRKAIDRVHQETPARTPFTGFARSRWEGHNPGDTTHFATVGNEYFGHTYNTGYIQALGNTKNTTSYERTL